MTKRSAEINEKVHERLRKLFAMLGSSNVSEREKTRDRKLTNCSQGIARLGTISPN
jgi:hypothetical protein